MLLLTFGAGSASAARPALVWSEPLGIETDQAQLSRLACPTIRLCLTTDDRGNLVTSTDPAGGASTWRKEHFDGGLVSCPSVSLCAANGPDGEVLTSTQPAGGVATWHATQLRAGDLDLGGVLCPLTSFCLVDSVDDGGAFVSNDPAGGQSSWHEVQLPGRFQPNVLTCPSPQLCVAVDQHKVAVSTGPPDDPSTWSVPTEIFPPRLGFLQGLSCPSTHLCVAVGGGRMTFSRRPAGGGSTWSRPVRIDPGAQRYGYLRDLSCPTVHLCVAIGLENRELESTSPTKASSWTHWRWIDPFGMWAGLACPSARLCLEVDDDGDVVIGTRSDRRELTVAAQVKAGKIAARVTLPGDATGTVTIAYTIYSRDNTPYGPVDSATGHHAATVAVRRGRAHVTFVPRPAALRATYVRITARYSGDSRHPLDTVASLVRLR